jgi:hypothetical protein
MGKVWRFVAPAALHKRTPNKSLPVEVARFGRNLFAVIGWRFPAGRSTLDNTAAGDVRRGSGRHPTLRNRGLPSPSATPWKLFKTYLIPLPRAIAG